MCKYSCSGTNDRNQTFDEDTDDECQWGEWKRNLSKSTLQVRSASMWDHTISILKSMMADQSAVATLIRFCKRCRGDTYIVELQRQDGIKAGKYTNQMTSRS